MGVAQKKAYNDTLANVPEKMGQDPGDESVGSSERSEREIAPSSTDGGQDGALRASTLGPDVLPRFEEPDPRPRRVREKVIPRIEESVPLSRIPAQVLPVFEEAFPEEDHTTSAVEDDVATPTIEDDFGISGPEYDEEMPLADHIEEMIKRLAVVIVIAGSVTLVTFPFADQLIDFLWYSILPGGEVAQPRVYGPLEFLITQIKVASLAGVIVALPVLVYETYAFMRPGLYRHERRYYLAAIPTSLVLAVIGVLFAYFIVLPALFTYFLVYSEEAGEIAFALAQTFDLMLILMAYLAIVFQIPLFIMLAIMMGLTTRQWLADKRLYFWGAFLGVAFLSSPDPTGMAPIIIALTMISLFEGTIGLLKWTGK